MLASSLEMTTARDTDERPRQSQARRLLRDKLSVRCAAPAQIANMRSIHVRSAKFIVRLALVLLAIFICTRAVSAETDQLSVQVALQGGTPATGATIRACTTDGTWHTPGECQYGGSVDANGEASVDLPGAAFHLSIIHEHITWFFDDEAPGSLSRSPADATTISLERASATSKLVVTIPAPLADYEFSYELEADANLVGWVGDQITAVDLFAQAPSVGAIAVLSPQGDRYTSVSRFQRSGGVAAGGAPLVVNHGDMVWLYATRDDPHTITFRTPEPREPLTLERGTVYTAFTGSESTSISHIMKGLGLAATSVIVLDKRGELTTSDTARTGDVLQINLTADRAFLPYDNRLPTVIFSPRLTEREIESITQDLEQQRRFFYDRFAISARGLAIYYGEHLEADTGRPLGVAGWAGKRSMWINGRYLFAHEYFHVLQAQLGIFGNMPEWLVEGTAQYGQWTFHYDGTDRELAYMERSLLALQEDPAQASIRLSDPGSYDSSDAWVSYGLGEVAAHWLADHVGESAIIELWRWSPEGVPWSWEAAFEYAFDLSVEEFDARFGAYLNELNARAAALPALVQVSGQVLSPSGEPISGYFVDIVDEPASEVSRWWPVRLDSAGRFERRLPPADYSIRLRTDDFQTIGYYRAGAPGNFTKSGEDRSVLDTGQLGAVEMQLLLPRVDPIRFTFTQPDGSAAAGVSAVICGFESGDCAYGRADDKGIMSLELLRGEYTVDVSRDGVHLGFYRAGTEGSLTFDLQQRSIVNSAELADLMVQVPVFHTLSVRIVGPEGDPVVGQGVDVIFEGPDELGSYTLGRTDSDGRFETSIVAGNYSIRLPTDAFQAIGYLRVGVAGNFTTSVDERTVFGAGDFETVEIQIPGVTLDPIRVTVTQPDGSAATGVWVSLCAAGGGDCQGGPVDDSGIRMVSVLRNDYIVSFTVDGTHVGYYSASSQTGHTDTYQQRTVFNSGEVPDISVRLPEVHTFSVRVVGPEGRPATGQRVEIVFEQPGERASYIPLRTDSDGRVNRSVSAGNYSIRLATDAFQGIGYLRVGVAGNFTTSADERTVFGAGDFEAVEIQIPGVMLDPIRVTVTRPDGSAAIGVWVSICAVGGGDCQQGPVDDSGVRTVSVLRNDYIVSFSVDGTHVGYYSAASQTGLTDSYQQRTVFNSGEVSDISVRLPEVHTFSVRVVGPDGNPAVGQRVDLVFERPGEGESYRPVRTDSEGRFEDSIVAGSYSIRLPTAAFQTIGYFRTGVSGSFTKSGDDRTVFEAGSFRTVEIVLPKVTLDPIRVTVTYADGSAATGVWVFICAPSGVDCAQAQIDARGIRTVSVLRDDYTVGFSLDGTHLGYYRSASQTGHTDRYQQRTVINSAEVHDIAVRLPANP